MSDDIKRNNGESPLDPALGGLVESALASGHDSFQRPPDESILAYVEGHATADQKKAVRTAMSLSRSFADQMLEHLEAQADLDDPDLARRLSEVEVPMEEMLDRARLVSLSRKTGRPQIDRPGFLMNVAQWFWRPSMGYGLAAAILVGMLLFPRPPEHSSGTITLAQYQPTRGGNGEYELVELRTGVETLNLVVQGAFDPKRGITFRTTLRREGEEEPLLFLAANRRSFPADGGLAHPVLQIDAAMLIPGRYELEFVPTLSDGTSLPDLSIRGRFEFPFP